MLVKTYAAAVQGISAFEVTIEVSVSPGIKFMLVGLPDNAVRESHERIYSALKHNGIDIPRRSVVINMAPADIRKEGSAYDLPLAIGMLAGNETIKTGLIDKYMMMGEMSLDGSLKSIKGALPIAILAREKGYKGLIVPADNAHEAAVVNNLDVIAADTIVDVVQFLNGEKNIEPTIIDTRAEFFASVDKFDVDFDEVKGQESVKRALEVAAAGGHNILMVGPPGAGKSMMSKRFVTILPPLTLHEALETTKIHSVAGKLEGNSGLITRRPFRNPHHTISDTALVGGGTYPQPGEISLAHNGVLFLDELPEFKRAVLEVLRQPLEDRKITVSRTKMTVDYPASFMLVASMNPCPCGYYNHPTKACQCSPTGIERYLNKISGPLMDRFDLHCEIQPVSFEDMSSKNRGEPSEKIRARVIRTREIQSRRFADEKGIYCNAQMDSKLLNLYAKAEPASINILGQAMKRLNLSARAYDRILKVSRTIADMDNSESIKPQHIAEAISYRSLDRENWGS